MNSSILFDGIKEGRLSEVKDFLKQLNPTDTLQHITEKKYNPLTSAVINGNLEALKLLHQFMDDSGQAIQPGTSEIDDVLCLAIINAKAKNGKEILEFVLEKWGAALAFVSIGETGQCALHVAASRDAVVVFEFLEGVGAEGLKEGLLGAIDSTAQNPLHLAASKGHVDTVKKLLAMEPSLAEQQDQNGETPLHKAAEADNLDVVKALLEANPGSIRKCDIHGRSAYVLARERRVHGRGPPGLNVDPKSYLREWIFKFPGLDLKEMRRLLSQAKELFWAMESFEKPGCDFSAYLKTLPKKTAKYESWLKCVRLPNLQCDPKHPDGIAQHTIGGQREASLVFGHLRKMNVERVFEVIVPDCLTHPHTNEAIIKCLRGLHVKRLAWHKMDLSVITIMEAAPEVEELCLYSSGNMDVLSHWASYEGLYHLLKLQCVDITIANNETDDEQNRAAIEERLRALIQHDHSVELHYQPGSALLEQAACTCQANRFREVRVSLPSKSESKGRASDAAITHAVDHDTIFARMAPLQKFLSRFKDQRKTRKDCAYAIDKPIKIAIIDNGVAEELFTDIEGCSFVEAGVESLSDSHWHTVSNPHGTQMAFLIDKMNKFRRLYCAKTHLGSSLDGLDLHAAAEAISWAMDQDVDIISMSWTLSDKASEEPRMRDIVSEAILDVRRRLVFSAVGDKGTNAEYSYPADFQSVIGISTTSISGVDPPTAESNKAKFSLPGEDLETPMPSYLGQGLGKVKGSSAATALAAGLASLILTLVRFAFYKEDKIRKPENESAERYFRDFRDPNNMMRVFKKMCTATEHRRFVQPWTVFPNAGELEKMDIDKFKETLVTFFEEALRK
ncbi:hypothetical protein GP486_002690 [Trichoglossum hirsutum]|uniref:Peptidase S8/S53 domain-containing protein n=1 Tax=Trichoglossum hirsutum TaxID=265104 RepID=A0A9P8LEK3_9PEZI|nr:hypothetical protein GP486_002690 [Trichoglossum hirsutum]